MTIHEVHPAECLGHEAVEWADTARDALAPLLGEEDGWAWRCVTDDDLELVSEPGTVAGGAACARVRGVAGGPDGANVTLRAEED